MSFRRWKFKKRNNNLLNYTRKTNYVNQVFKNLLFNKSLPKRKEFKSESLKIYYLKIKKIKINNKNNLMTHRSLKRHSPKTLIINILPNNNNNDLSMSKSGKIL